MAKKKHHSYLIVDGYNIINAWDGLKEISKEINIDMENATIDISDGNIKINKEKAGIQLDLKALIDALFIEVNPVPVKTALNLLGFDVGHLRLPLGEMNPKNLEVLKQELINAGLEVK